MSYDIIVRFPSKEFADAFCGQMSDGFGEGWCDWRSYRQKPGTTGKRNKDFERITGSAPEGTPIHFVNDMEEY